MKKYKLVLEIFGIVIALLFLLSLCSTGHHPNRDKAKESEVKQNLHTIQVAIEKYAVDHDGQYPAYLIGGDMRYAEKFNNLTDVQDIENRLEMSDPLLREGYLDSYPRNPFARNGAAIAKFQSDKSDPLRNSLSVTKQPEGEPTVINNEGAVGNVYGTRFGGDCRMMGNVSCDYRYPIFETEKPDGTKEEHPSGADFDGYPFFDVWHGNRPSLYLPGEFFYKATGPVVSIEQTADNVALQPVEIDRYILGGYGSIRTKGVDVFGTEPRVAAYATAYFNVARYLSKAIVFHGEEKTKVIESPNACVRVIVPSWTRWLNKKNTDGTFPGSPYSVSTESGQEQLTPGNPNGIPDGIVCVLTSEDK